MPVMHPADVHWASLIGNIQFLCKTSALIANLEAGQVWFMNHDSTITPVGLFAGLYQWNTGTCCQARPWKP